MYYCLMPIILIINRMYYSLVKCSMNQYETTIMDVHITYLYSLGKIEMQHFPCLYVELTMKYSN